jgi:hypothetical protein
MSKEKNRNHPICDDIEKWAIDSFKSHSFFDVFLGTVFGDPFNIRDHEE